ncbi:MAG: hypothetical protein L3J12_03060 [Spirochaetales bacterium]|nr:hypothetical protein [Spirochaetales bacterium]
MIERLTILNDNVSIMEAGNDYLTTLEISLEKKREELEKREMTVLKEKIRLFTSAYEGIYNTFLKKGLISEDPYKYDQKISEITPPSAENILDSDKINQMSQRLSMYDSQLDFLNSFYEFSTNYITMSRLKKIISLINWVKWEKLSEASTAVNTKIFAELVGKVVQGTDNMSTGLLKDSLTRLGKISREIVGISKNIFTYQKEKYKYDIRINLIETLGISRENMQTNPDNVLFTIKRNFVKILGKGIPFYSELIKEIFKEESEPEGESLRAEVLNKLKVEDSKREEKKDINYRKLLMDTVKVIATILTPLEQALSKLEFNIALSEEKTLTFSEKFRIWIMNLSGKENTVRIIDIDIFDERISATRTVRLNLNEYMESTRKTMRIVGALSNKVSATTRKLESASEEAVLNFINKTIEDLHLIINKLDPINTYFRGEVGISHRNSIKGIKIEITTMKNTLIKANQKRHEYISRMEEIEQMKKLGVL